MRGCLFSQISAFDFWNNNISGRAPDHKIENKKERLLWESER